VLHAYVNLFEATTHGQRRVDQPASLEHRGGAKSRITRTPKRRQKATIDSETKTSAKGGNGNGNTTVRDKLLRSKPNRESGIRAPSVDIITTATFRVGINCKCMREQSINIIGLVRCLPTQIVLRVALGGRSVQW